MFIFILTKWNEAATYNTSECIIYIYCFSNELFYNIFTLI